METGAESGLKDDPCFMGPSGCVKWLQHSYEEVNKTADMLQST